jgi:hypothetical protein
VTVGTRVQQTLLDIADLEVKTLGKLEWSSSIGRDTGYLRATRSRVKSNRLCSGCYKSIISRSNTTRICQADIRGRVTISQLQSLERFHEYLEELTQLKLTEVASPLMAPTRLG